MGFKAGSFYNPVNYIQDEVLRRFVPSSLVDEIAVRKSEHFCSGSVSTLRRPLNAIAPDILSDDGVAKPQTLPQQGEKTFRLVGKYGKKYTLTETDICQLSSATSRGMASQNDFIQALIEAHVEGFKLFQTSDLIRKIYYAAHVENRGNNAGMQTHSIDVGSQTSPFTLDEDNIHSYLSRTTDVMRETNSGLSNPYGLGGRGLFSLIQNSERLSSYYHQGGCKQCCYPDAMNSMGTCNSMLYETDCLPKFSPEGSDDVIIPYIFGHREAVWYWMDFKVDYAVNPEVGNNNKELHLAWHYYAEVIDPRLLGVGHIIINRS